MSAPNRVQAGDDVIYQPLHDEVVLLKLTSQQYFGLNDIGTSMWKLLMEHCDTAVVIDRLCEEYVVDRETAQRDVDVLVANLINAGLLKAAGQSTD
jgi:hypothetical protein